MIMSSDAAAERQSIVHPFEPAPESEFCAWCGGGDVSGHREATLLGIGPEGGYGPEDF